MTKRMERRVTPDPDTTRGHFPGRPIVPGVALLDAVWRAALEDGAATGATAEMGGIRFLRTVAPGDSLQLATEPRDPGIRFELRDPEGVAVRGWMVGGNLDAAAGCGAKPPLESLALDLARLLPHRPPMRLLETVHARDGGSAVASGRIAPDCPLGDGRHAPAFALVEIAAQTAAAHGALAAADDGDEPPVGAIVAISEMRFACASIPVGMRVIAEAQLTTGSGTLSRYDVAVRGTAGEPLVLGRLVGLRVLP